MLRILHLHCLISTIYYFYLLIASTYIGNSFFQYLGDIILINCNIDVHIKKYFAVIRKETSRIHASQIARQLSWFFRAISRWIDLQANACVSVRCDTITSREEKKFSSKRLIGYHTFDSSYFSGSA